jgi:hypothetical protein
LWNTKLHKRVTEHLSTLCRKKVAFRKQALFCQSATDLWQPAQPTFQTNILVPQQEDEQTDAAKLSHNADGNLYIPATSTVATEDLVGMP